VDGGLIVETTPGAWAIYTELFVTEDASLYVVVAKDLTEYPENKEAPYVYTWIGPNIHRLLHGGVSPYATTIEDLIWCFETNLFSTSQVIGTIERYLSMPTPITTALQALSVISRVYKLLPGAKAAVEILSRPLAQTKWINAMHRDSSAPPYINLSTEKIFDVELLDRKIAFSCVAYLESGHCDIDPSSIDEAIALSSGDSIYVTMPVRCRSENCSIS